MRYLVDSVIGTDRIGGRNDSMDIPVDTIFTRVVKSRVSGDPMNLETTELGEVATVSLRLVGVEHFGMRIDFVPADHSPLLFVDGDDLSTLAALLASCDDGDYLWIVADA